MLLVDVYLYFFYFLLEMGIFFKYVFVAVFFIIHAFLALIIILLLRCLTCCHSFFYFMYVLGYLFVDIFCHKCITYEIFDSFTSLLLLWNLNFFSIFMIFFIALDCLLQLWSLVKVVGIISEYRNTVMYRYRIRLWRFYNRYRIFWFTKDFPWAVGRYFKCLWHLKMYKLLIANLTWFLILPLLCSKLILLTFLTAWLTVGYRRILRHWL